VFGISDLLYSIDATAVDRLGKFVNDAPRREANCVAKLLMIDSNPHIAIFASRDIEPGEEIDYDYGGKDLPWRKVTLFTFDTSMPVAVFDMVLTYLVNLKIVNVQNMTTEDTLVHLAFWVDNAPV